MNAVFWGVGTVGAGKGGLHKPCDGLWEYNSVDKVGKRGKGWFLES